MGSFRFTARSVLEAVMSSLYRSHLQQGWRHVLFHAPYKPIDVLLIGTLIVYTPLIVVLTCGENLFGYTSSSAIAWSFVNLVTMVVIVGLRAADSMQIYDAAVSPAASGLVAFAADFAALPLMFLLAHETSVIPALIWHNSSLDTQVQEIEHSIWGCQPARDFSTSVHSHAVGEYLTCCHTIWPLVLLGTLAAFRAKGSSVFNVGIGLAGVSLVVSLLLPVAIPVHGPPAKWMRAPAELGYVSPHLMMHLSALDPRHSFTLPCQRVAIGMTVWMKAWSVRSWTAYALLLVLPAMALSTVYSGWSYSIDVVAGMGAASFSWVCGLPVVNALEDWTEERIQRWHGGGCCVLSKYGEAGNDRNNIFSTSAPTHCHETSVLINSEY